MVIKQRYKSLKNQHNPEGFMLLEAVALVGFVALVGIEISSLHGLIMNTYYETTMRMSALSYAENVMASALTGTSNTPSHNTLSYSSQFYGTVPAQKDFKSVITRTRGISFLPSQKPYTVVTAKVSWREQGQEKKIELTRLVLDEQVPA